MHLGAHLQEIYENIHLRIMAQGTSRYMFKKICFMFCILMKNMFNFFQYERYMLGFCYLQKNKWNCIRKYFSLFISTRYHRRALRFLLHHVQLILILVILLLTFRYIQLSKYVMTAAHKVSAAKESIGIAKKGQQ